MKIFECCKIQGDSGGPLTYESNGQHILIGATSFGLDGCDSVKLPDVLHCNINII